MEITPAANRSEEVVAPSPRILSGARYPDFPARVPSSARPSPAARDMPKSVTLFLKRNINDLRSLRVQEIHKMRYFRRIKRNPRATGDVRRKEKLRNNRITL